jgi:hypothetical protein
VAGNAGTARVRQGREESASSCLPPRAVSYGGESPDSVEARTTSRTRGRISPYAEHQGQAENCSATSTRSCYGIRFLALRFFTV